MLLRNVRYWLDGKSDEEKLHSMLNEEFCQGVDVDEESGLVYRYGPFKHAFKCIAKYAISCLEG